jgi:tetratricopeptide (TPR) repeat protein
VLHKKLLPGFFALASFRKSRCYHSFIVTFRAYFVATTLLALLACAAQPRVSFAQRNNLDRDFQSAVAQYEAGHYPEAAAQLEKLLPQVPQSFDVHELLGLVYAAQSMNDKAHDHFEAAVRLKPDSASARTNLGNNLLQLGKPDLAELQFKKAVALEPNSYDANHDLGELYVRANKISVAIPCLERAHRANPSAYDNGYDLALAYLFANRLPDARNLIQSLLKLRDTAELHDLLAEVEEKSGNFIAAANEFQTAARMDPSESNIFDWGSELLVHRTLEPAIEVFRQGTERYPNSPRLFIGLGMACYSLGKYDDAVKSLLRAADLNPSDPRGYPFLSRAFDSSPSQAGEVISRFRRYSELQPNNGQAVYYYAMSLWKGKRAEDPNLDLSQIEALLKKSLALSPNLAEAHLQLANLYSDQRKYAESIPEYLRARELNPDLADVHYRLAQAYVRTGEKDLAQQELQVYQQLRAGHLSDLDKHRAEIRQFVYAEKRAGEAKP